MINSHTYLAIKKSIPIFALYPSRFGHLIFIVTTLMELPPGLRPRYEGRFLRKPCPRTNIRTAEIRSTRTRVRIIVVLCKPRNVDEMEEKKAIHRFFSGREEVESDDFIVSFVSVTPLSAVAEGENIPTQSYFFPLLSKNPSEKKSFFLSLFFLFFQLDLVLLCPLAMLMQLAQ